MAGARRGSGFWRGFAAGLLLAAVVALALAWAVPPLRAPALAPDTTEAPVAPVGVPEPAMPEAPGSLVPGSTGQPPVEGAGSPSLVPGGATGSPPEPQR